MKSLYLSGARALSIAVLSFGLVACGGEEEIAKTFDPVAFHPDNECHVCGMIIEEYPGPKGQAVTDKQARSFLRMFLSGASQEMPDSQNRITIPGHLRQYAGLEKELVVTGVGAHAEIWDASAWNAYLESNEESYSDLEQEVIPGLF